MKVTHLVIRRERPGGKLKPRYIGPYRILRRIEPLVYCLELYLELSQIHNVFHVSMLKWYILDPSHNLEAPPIGPNEDLLFEVQSAVIDNQGMKQLRSKVIPFNQVLSRSDTMEEMTWETEASMRNYYLYLLDVQCVNFGDKIPIRGVEM